MATFSATFFWGGFRHPMRALQRQWSRYAAALPKRSGLAEPAFEQGAQSPERLERIAAYARCGYFHVEYTAGMFVVPLDTPPE